MKVRRVPSRLSNRVRETHVYLRSTELDAAELETGWSYKIEKNVYTHGLILYCTNVQYERGGKSVGCLHFFGALDLARANLSDVQEEVRKHYAHFLQGG